MFDADKKEIELIGLNIPYFTLDSNYANKLSNCKEETVDFNMLIIAKAPYILIKEVESDKADKDDEGHKVYGAKMKYSLYLYIEKDADAYFLECDFKLVGTKIVDFERKKNFSAKKMPKLFIGERNSEATLEKPTGK